MARSKGTVPLEALSPEDVTPLVGANGPTLLSALQAISTWATSRAVREQVMADCDFPLPGDLSAFLVINQLVYRGIARPTDLADAVDTTRSNLSKIVARLQGEGLVFRATDPRDDRGVVIGLTRDGRELGHRILGALRPDERLVAGWSAEEYETLERLLIKLAATIDAFPGHPLRAAAGTPFPFPGDR